MRLALAISTLVAAGAVLSLVAVTVASPDSGGAVAHAQAAPCPSSTPVVASEAAPAVQSRVTMPQTGNAGLLPGSRRPLALQGAPACPVATETPAAVTSATAAPSTTATTTAASTSTPSVSLPGGVGGIGGIGGIGGGGY